MAQGGSLLSRSNTQIYTVPKDALVLASTLDDPLDAELFQKPQAAPVAPSSKRKRTPSTASNKRQATGADGVVNVSSAERKARSFVQNKLQQLTQAEQQSQSAASSNTPSTQDHSISGGSYVNETCSTLLVKSIFSDVVFERNALSKSFEACLQLVAYQAYNSKADVTRGQRLLRGEQLDPQYMQLVRQADLFRTWRSTLYTSLLVNIGEAAQAQRQHEANVGAEPNEPTHTMHPLAMQKFLGYMLWVPMESAPDTLAGKKNCYTCSTPLREGQSSCYTAPRLTRVDRTGVPQQHGVHSADSTPETRMSDTTATHNATVEIIGEHPADRIVHFQICSQCNETVGLWLGIRDLFRCERNNAIRSLRAMMQRCDANRAPRPKLQEFVAAYVQERTPNKLSQDIFKCLRALINTLCMFLRTSCSESTARRMSCLFYDIFPRDDPRNNPDNKPVDPPSRATKIMEQMVDMNVEQRLEHLQHLMDPHASEDIGALWRSINCV